jgi:hypothetical protein
MTTGEVVTDGYSGVDRFADLGTIVEQASRGQIFVVSRVFQIRPIVSGSAIELSTKISARHARRGAHRASRRHLRQSAAPSQRAVTA